MNKEEIKNMLPHRDNMLLIDEAVENGKAYGSYTVRGNEFFLNGHFPGNPVVPGVMLCEMMAQVCCVLLYGKTESKTPFFTSLNNVKFKNIVKPGDTVLFECEMTAEKLPFYFAKGKGLVNGKLSVSGEFSFALIDK